MKAVDFGETDTINLVPHLFVDPEEIVEWCEDVVALAKVVVRDL